MLGTLGLECFLNVSIRLGLRMLEKNTSSVLILNCRALMAYSFNNGNFPKHPSISGSQAFSRFFFFYLPSGMEAGVVSILLRTMLLSGL